MADRPTVRIPDWSSTGTKTDPGAGKEASGWSISEKPPAYWLNWLGNTRDQWMAYVAEMIPLSIMSISITSGPTATLDWGMGKDLDGTTPFAFTGTDLVLEILFDEAFCTTLKNSMALTTTDMNGGGSNYSLYRITGTTSKLSLTLHEGMSTAKTWGLTTNEQGQIYIALWGDSP